MKAHHLFSLLLVLSAPVVRGQTVTVNFDDATLGPSDTLQIGGVTATTDISPGEQGGPLATVAGLGLGLDNGVGTIGGIGEIERQLTFPANPPSTYYVSSDTGSGPFIQFSVDGTINSITIVPNFSIMQADGSILPNAQCPMELNLSGILNADQEINPPISSPVTFNQFLTGISTVYLYDQQNFSPFSPVNAISPVFFNEFYDPSQEQIVQFGFTVQSLNYTPTPTPEPTTLALACVGFATLLMFRRQYSAPQVNPTTRGRRGGESCGR